MPKRKAALLAERSLSLPADRDRFTDLVDAVESFGVMCDRRDPEGWLAFVTAVSEVGGNILVHAYQGGNPGSVELTLRCFRDRVEASFRDWGAAFEEPPGAGLAGKADDLDDLDAILGLDESGRGLALARVALTSLDYERTAPGENHWRLMKKLPTSTKLTGSA